MMNSSEKKNYPNLEKCVVHVPPRYTSLNSGSTFKPAPIDTKINPAWIVSAEAPLPELYNFQIGKYSAVTLHYATLLSHSLNIVFQNV